MTFQNDVCYILHKVYHIMYLKLLRDKFMQLYILRKEIGVGWSYMSQLMKQNTCETNLETICKNKITEIRVKENNCILKVDKLSVPAIPTGCIYTKEIVDLPKDFPIHLKPCLYS